MIYSLKEDYTIASPHHGLDTRPVVLLILFIFSAVRTAAAVRLHASCPHPWRRRDTAMRLELRCIGHGLAKGLTGGGGRVAHILCLHVVGIDLDVFLQPAIDGLAPVGMTVQVIDHLMVRHVLRPWG